MNRKIESIIRTSRREREREQKRRRKKTRVKRKIQRVLRPVANKFASGLSLHCPGRKFFLIVEHAKSRGKIRRQPSVRHCTPGNCPRQASYTGPLVILNHCPGYSTLSSPTNIPQNFLQQFNMTSLLLRFSCARACTNTYTICLFFS